MILIVGLRFGYSGRNKPSYPNLPYFQKESMLLVLELVAVNTVMTERSSGSRDRISDAPGAHPVGTGIGAAAGGIAAAAAAGTLAAGPVGTVIGAAVGAVAGGLAGNAVAESLDPTVDLVTNVPAPRRQHRKPGVRTLDLTHRIQEARANAQRAKDLLQQVQRTAGLPTTVLVSLESWLELEVDARVMEQYLEFQRLVDVTAPEVGFQLDVAAADPVEPLTAAALGQALGDLSDETVRARERAGELFSILRPGRKRGREYPAFQAWTGIAGEPLAQVLEILRAHSGTAAYGFFTSPNRELASLTPIELMIGGITHPRELPHDAGVLLEAPNTERLESVLAAAQGYAADLAA